MVPHSLFFLNYGVTLPSTSFQLTDFLNYSITLNFLCQAVLDSLTSLNHGVTLWRPSTMLCHSLTSFLCNAMLTNFPLLYCLQDEFTKPAMALLSFSHSRVTSDTVRSLKVNQQVSSFTLSLIDNHLLKTDKTPALSTIPQDITKWERKLTKQLRLLWRFCLASLHML